jgi:hypothetical protein
MVELPDWLEAGESLIWSRRANHTQGPARAVGGRLFLTDRRIVFVPHAFDRDLWGRAWSCPLSEIAEVGEEPRTWGLFDGGMRRRLRVTPNRGDKALFVVNKLRDAVQQIRAAAITPNQER